MNYKKEYTDVMQGKKIMYVHGFASSAQSGTVKRLRETFPSATIVAEDIPLDPEEAIVMLREMAEREQPDLIVGTSMGGMYAEQLYGYDRILVNPAFEMGETMASHGMMGQQTFMNERRDGVQNFIVTKALVKKYKQMTEQNFSGVDEEEQKRVYGLFGIDDPLVNTYDIFMQHYPNAIRFNGEHRMDDRSFLHAVVPVIRWIDDKQADRQRPIIYIGIETLIDNYGNPTSSSQKAFRMLIEHYQVFFVAPAYSCEPDKMAETHSWLMKHFDAPVWNHVVFSNQRHLLLGDFLIAPQKSDDFMGTCIEYGSDTFKTWEEIITFYERTLGIG